MKRQIPVNLIFILLITVIHIAFLPTAMAEKKIFKMKFSHAVTENTPKGWGAREFAKRVNNELKGRVFVEVFPNGSLYQDNQAIEAVSSGILEMAAPSMEKFMGLIPELRLFDIPFLFSELKSVHRTMDGSIGDEIKTLFSRRGVDIMLLDFWDNAFKQFTCNTRPLIIPSDFNGLKLIIMGEDILSAQINALGGSAFKLPFPDVFSLLEKGIMDGQENTISNIYTRKYHTIQKYFTFSNHGYLGYAVIINQPFWNNLPWIIQKKVSIILKAVTLEVRQKAIETEHRNYDLLKLYEKRHGDFKIFQIDDDIKKVWQDAVCPIQQKSFDTVPERWINTIKKF